MAGGPAGRAGDPLHGLPSRERIAGRRLDRPAPPRIRSGAPPHPRRRSHLPALCAHRPPRLCALGDALRGAPRPLTTGGRRPAGPRRGGREPQPPERRRPVLVLQGGRARLRPRRGPDGGAVADPGGPQGGGPAGDRDPARLLRTATVSRSPPSRAHGRGRQGVQRLGPGPRAGHPDPTDPGRGAGAARGVDAGRPSPGPRLFAGPPHSEPALAGGRRERRRKEPDRLRPASHRRLRLSRRHGDGLHGPGSDLRRHRQRHLAAPVARGRTPALPPNPLRRGGAHVLARRALDRLHVERDRP